MGLDILLFLLLGLFVGTFGTLVGIGGGLICVPIFIFFLSDGGIYPYFHTAAQITGTSLVIVCANALSGTFAYIRQKRVYFAAAVPFALATLPGAFLGSYIVDDFTGPMLYISYGSFLLLMALMMYWNAMNKKHADVHTLPANFTFNRSLGVGASAGVGFISSIFGIGGGVIHVPLMVYLLGFPVHVATASSPARRPSASLAMSGSVMSSGRPPSASPSVPPSAHRSEPPSRKRQNPRSSSFCLLSPCSGSDSV